MSYTPTAAEVKRLRDETGAGMMECKAALVEADGNPDEAKDILRKKGLAGVEKRAGRVAAEGVVESYVHRIDPELPARVGVLVELNCETDFVAKTAQFKKLARGIAMHIAWMEPRWIRRDEVPVDFVEHERKLAMESSQVAGKPPQVVEQIVEGKMKKLLAEQGGVLLDQVFTMDESGRKTVGEAISDLAASVKENVVVRRFARFKLGEAE